MPATATRAGLDLEAAVKGLTNVALHPAGPMPATCQQPPAAPVECKATAFNGTMFARPVQLIYMVLFSFEVDLLEVLLHEAHDEVTKVVLIESNQTHQRQLRKPLLWPQLMQQARFAQFADKVEHVVPPEAQRAGANIWHVESKSTRAGMEAIWAKRHQWHLQPHDRVVSGDVDEILGTATLRSLRWCGMRHGMGTGGGLWMPMGTLDRAFRPDWTVGGNPLAFATPTIYEWEYLRRNHHMHEWGIRHFKPASPHRCTFGGIHLTNTAFVPLNILKDLTGTEYHAADATRKLALAQTLAGANRLQTWITELDDKPGWKGRTKPLSSLRQSDVRAVVFKPWLLRCPGIEDRFPYLFRRLDPRNAQLARVILALGNASLPNTVDFTSPRPPPSIMRSMMHPRAWSHPTPARFSRAPTHRHPTSSATTKLRSSAARSPYHTRSSTFTSHRATRSPTS